MNLKRAGVASELWSKVKQRLRYVVTFILCLILYFTVALSTEYRTYFYQEKGASRSSKSPGYWHCKLHILILCFQLLISAFSLGTLFILSPMMFKFMMLTKLLARLDPISVLQVLSEMMFMEFTCTSNLQTREREACLILLESTRNTSRNCSPFAAKLRISARPAFIILLSRSRNSVRMATDTLKPYFTAKIRPNLFLCWERDSEEFTNNLFADSIEDGFQSFLWMIAGRANHVR